MADHRLTDLTHGLLGKPIYDPETGWKFSADITQDQDIQTVLPIEECIPPSLQAVTASTPRTTQNHLKNLVKENPELYPANNQIIDISSSQTPSDSGALNGSLFSIGRAYDREKTSTGRAPLIVAMPCAEAGHVLRLLKPSNEKRGWGKQSAAMLSLPVIKSSDEGLFKVGTGGPIRQIAFANENTSEGTWLAVRQSDATTVFRVVYSINGPDVYPNVVTPVSSSKLAPVSVATLSTLRTKSSSHADITFNPLYTRQFAVVDTSGRWSVWDIESRRGQPYSSKLIAGNTGNMYDGQIPESTFKGLLGGESDGWHRILWVSNLRTLLICNRQHLAVIDMKDDYGRLDMTDFVNANGSDLILDIKRSTSSMKRVFVLTTSRIFWVEISPAEEDKKEQGALKILVSYRHFRDRNDKSMKLTALVDDNVSVLIYSGSNNLMNLYCFSSDNNGLETHRAYQKSFLITGSGEEQWHGSIQTMQLLPLRIESRETNGAQGPELAYLKNEIRFVQSWILTSDLGLNLTLHAIQSIIKEPIAILCPTTKLSRSLHTGGPRSATGPFTAPNLIFEFIPPAHEQKTAGLTRTEDLRVDWRRIFQNVVLRANQDAKRETAADIETLLGNIHEQVNAGMREENLKMATLLDMSLFKNLTNSLEQTTEQISSFLGSLPLPDGQASSSLIITNLARSLGANFAPTSLEVPQLMSIYSFMVDKWISGLPLEVSNAARGSKFRIVRQVAVELCLASIAISLQNKSVRPPLEEVEEAQGSQIRDRSPAAPRMSLDPEDLRESTIVTSARSSSVNSQTTSTSGLTENPAITRLRQYATTIKARPDFGQSKLLSEWPPAPGVDPSTYSYKPPALDDSEEELQQSKRESARRKKRTEKFLQRLSGTGPRTPSTPFGSQPPEAPHPGFSSQPSEAFPMTQPDRGAFGSRPATSKKKQQKKRRAAGFK